MELENATRGKPAAAKTEPGKGTFMPEIEIGGTQNKKKGIIKD